MRRLVEAARAPLGPLALEVPRWAAVAPTEPRVPWLREALLPWLELPPADRAAPAVPWPGLAQEVAAAPLKPALLDTAVENQ